VEFHWLPKYDLSTAPTLDILTPPKSTGGSRADMQLYDFSTDRRICSGQIITLTTEDPEKLPLPHPALLEMQWILHRLTAMSGGAEIYDGFDNDDDDAMALWNEEYPYEEEEWDSYIEDDNWNSYEEPRPLMMGHQSSPPTVDPQSSLPTMDSRSSLPTMDPQSSLPSSSLRQPSPPRQPSLPHHPKRNIRSDYIPLLPAENLDSKIIGSSQGE